MTSEVTSEAKIIASDIGALARTTAQIVAIVSGGIAMIATGTLFSGVALGKTSGGIEGFYAVMSLTGFGSNHQILHTTLVGMNWIVLIGLPLFLIKESLRNYRQSVVSRAESACMMANAKRGRSAIRPMREVVHSDKASNS